MKSYSQGILSFVIVFMISGCAQCSHSGQRSLRQQEQQTAYKNSETTARSRTPNTPINPIISSNTGNNNPISAIVQQTEPCVFVVYNLDNNGNSQGQGTGFFINASGIGVSNYHVFEGGSSWVIKTTNGEQFRVKEIIKQSSEFDFVVFTVETNKLFPYLDLAQTLPRKGDEILVLGNPKGLESTLTRGIVSSIRGETNPDDYIQIDAAISPGSSGSPVVNMQGKVVGIATLKIKECENCNFAINIQRIK